MVGKTTENFTEYQLHCFFSKPHDSSLSKSPKQRQSPPGTIQYGVPFRVEAAPVYVLALESASVKHLWLSTSVLNSRLLQKHYRVYKKTIEK
jgi:hypothetical protein